MKSIVIICVLFVAACADKNNDAQGGAKGVEPSVVLATVNGVDITEKDVAFTIDRTFSDVDQLFISNSIEEKVLDSLVAAKAMRHHMEKSLPENAIDEIKMKVDAYEDELFVKAYLKEKANPIPVSVEMVADYYESNPEQFGGGTLKTVELLQTKKRLSGKERETFLAQMQNIKSAENWQELATTGVGGVALTVKRIKVQPGLLDKNIEAAVNGLSPGETSGVIQANNQSTVARVLSEEILPVKPLHEVSAEIRKKLAPLQLKKAVKKASEEAIKNADVTMLNTSKSGN